MITAEDFSGTTCQGFSFGIDRQKTAAKLREIADALELPYELANPKEPTRRTPFVLQEITLKQAVGHEDFTISELTLRYAERREPTSVPGSGVPEHQAASHSEVVGGSAE